MLLEQKILEKIDTTHLKEIDKERLIYGMKLLISEFKKIFIIYGVALLLGCIIPTFITHLSFYLIKQVSYGFHFKSYLGCILISIFIFPISTFFIKYSDLGIDKNLLFLLPFFIVIYLIGPIGTDKHPIINIKHKRHLKNKIINRSLLVMILFVLLPEIYSIYIILGIFIQLIFLLLQLMKVRFNL